MQFLERPLGAAFRGETVFIDSLFPADINILIPWFKNIYTFKTPDWSIIKGVFAYLGNDIKQFRPFNELDF